MDNITAKVSCFARAYHFENNKTHIFADGVAARLLGDDYDHIAESMIQGINFFLPGFEGTKEEGLRLIIDKQLSPSVLGRSAYCERKLLDKIKTECRDHSLNVKIYLEGRLKYEIERFTDSGDCGIISEESKRKCGYFKKDKSFSCNLYGYIGQIWTGNDRMILF